ncbi:hypothetical protein NL676_009909 [Syzygium grande]|nr:hypothetical protein NL676_009909 [Syzygium grande]
MTRQSQLMGEVARTPPSNQKNRGFGHHDNGYATPRVPTTHMRTQSRVVLSRNFPPSRKARFVHHTLFQEFEILLPPPPPALVLLCSAKFECLLGAFFAQFYRGLLAKFLFFPPFSACPSRTVLFLFIGVPSFFLASFLFPFLGGSVMAVVLEILRGAASGGSLGEALVLVACVGISVILGVLVGWSWRPRWANPSSEFLNRENNNNNHHSLNQNFLNLSALASTGVSSVLSLNSLRLQLPSWVSRSVEDVSEAPTFSDPPTAISDSSPSRGERDKSSLVKGDDLEHLCRLVEVKDGGPAWIQMMDRSVPTMSYQAWRRDPETGPPQYRSRTVFEDATPEMVRDFFWDDEFRSKWDDMLVHSSILEECPTTGTMMVQWVRKFPFFCSDREYIIGRRIWESGRSYYCVTKGVPCSSIPRRNKPRRVDLYYSSWCIRAVESRRGDGQLTACEVLLFHHEDMGIPWEIAKLGVRQGMWGAVKKIEPGLREYQKERASEAPRSRCAFLAQINTKVRPDHLKSLESAGKEDSSEIEARDESRKPLVPKLLLVGGAIALACSLDRGLLTRAVIFGVARRFGNVGRKL